MSSHVLSVSGHRCADPDTTTQLLALGQDCPHSIRGLSATRRLRPETDWESTSSPSLEEKRRILSVCRLAARRSVASLPHPVTDHNGGNGASDLEACGVTFPTRLAPFVHAASCRAWGKRYTAG